MCPDTLPNASLWWRLRPGGSGLGALFSGSSFFEVVPVAVKFGKHCVLVRRRRWHPTPVLLPGKSHGWRSPVGCSPWGREESDMTERLHFHFSLLCIGEGNGNPLQCSCLEHPRDGGAQSRTGLQWLSSGSSSVLVLLLFCYLSCRVFNTPVWIVTVQSVKVCVCVCVCMCISAHMHVH